MENTFLVPDHDLVTDHEPVVVKIEGSPIVSPIGKREKIKRFGKRMGTKVVALGKGIFHYTQKPAFKRGFRLSCYIGGAGTLFYIFKPILSVNAVDLPGSNQFGPPGKRSNSEYLKTWVSPTAWRAYLDREKVTLILKGTKNALFPFILGGVSSFILNRILHNIITQGVISELITRHNFDIQLASNDLDGCVEELKYVSYDWLDLARQLRQKELLEPMSKARIIAKYIRQIPLNIPNNILFRSIWNDNKKT